MMMPLPGRSFWLSLATTALCLAASPASALPGDWAMMNFDAHGTRYNRFETTLDKKNVASLQLAWKADIGAKFGSPAVVGGVVYVGGGSAFYALNAVTGATIWSSAFTDANWSSPAVVNGVVYVASVAGVLDAFDAASGNMLWSATLDTRSPGSPTAAEGHVFIQDGFGKTYAFNARTGKLQWKESVPSNSFIGDSAPSVANGTVFTQTETQGLVAYNARTGAQVWVDGDRLGTGALVADGQKLYTFGTEIAALDAATGAQIWSRGFGPRPSGGFALANNRLYMLDGSGSDPDIWQFNATTGVVSDKRSDPITEFTALPTFANGVLYTGTSGNGKSISAYNAKTGEQLWGAQLDWAATAGPVVSNGMVYAVASSPDGSAGSVTAFALPH